MERKTNLITRRLLVGAGLFSPLLPMQIHSNERLDFQQIAARARGQTVYWNAWGGSPETNAFLRWVGEQVKARYGVTLTHVRLRDTAEAVTRVLAEKQAGRLIGGGIDLIWINGPNFLAMKTQGLLFGPMTETLPNWKHVDTINRPSNIVDFTVPVEGFAAPWRTAQVVFVHDSARLPINRVPRSMAAMLDWAKAHPGRLAHPNGRNFLGSTFLKQALIEFALDKDALSRPVDEPAFAAATGDL